MSSVYLREFEFPGGGGLCPGAVVVKDRGDSAVQRYVVHTRNDTYGGYTNGYYTNDRDKADVEFAARCDRYRTRQELTT